MEDIAENPNTILRLSYDRIAEIEVLCEFRKVYDIMQLEDNAAELPVNIVITGSFSQDSKQTWSSFMPIPDLLIAIEQLRVLIENGKQPYYLRFRVDATSLADLPNISDTTYRLYQVVIGEQEIPQKDLDIKLLDTYRYFSAKEYQRNNLSPYANTERAVEMHKAMMDGLVRTWGHQVSYLKITEDRAAVNHTFRVYEKYYLEAIKYLHILVPDNDFKDRQIVYTDWNATYEEDVEIHITIDAFQRAFGPASRPEVHDIIFLPQTNTLYDVLYSHAERGFMNEFFYYKVLLRKHVKMTKIDLTGSNPEDETNETEFNIGDFVDTAVRDMNDILDPAKVPTDRAQLDAEAEHTNLRNRNQAAIEGLNASQLQSYYQVSNYESLRQIIQQRVKLIESNLRNFMVTFSTQQYLMADVPLEQIAIKYRQEEAEVSLLTLTHWLLITNRNSDFRYLQFGELSMHINRQTIDIKIQQRLLHSVELSRNQYYFITLKVDQPNFSAELIVLRRSSEDDAQTQQKLVEVYRQGFAIIDNLEITPGDLSADLALYGGQYHLTNLRLYRKLWPEEKLHGLATTKTAEYTDSIVIDNTTQIPN